MKSAVFCARVRCTVFAYLVLFRTRSAPLWRGSTTLDGVNNSIIDGALRGNCCYHTRVTSPSKAVSGCRPGELHHTEELTKLRVPGAVQTLCHVTGMKRCCVTRSLTPRSLLADADAPLPLDGVHIYTEYTF